MSRTVGQLSKAVNCSCGECLLNHDGKAIRQTVVKTDGDSLFALCLKCKGHTRLGKFEAIEPPKPERASKSRLKIVYMTK